MKLWLRTLKNTLKSKLHINNRAAGHYKKSLESAQVIKQNIAEVKELQISIVNILLI